MALPVSREHVIPTSILNLAAVGPNERWPLVLMVHQECERVHKTERDHLAKLVQRMGGWDIGEWSVQEFKQFQSKCDVRLEQVGEWPLVPVVSGIQDAFAAAFIWVRGFHTALYREVLPEAVKNVVGCPAPGFRSDAPDYEGQVRGGNDLASLVLSVINKARNVRQVDRVVLRGGAVQYHCTWLHDPTASALDETWTCFWAIDLPGSPNWAISVRGRDVPWHGMFSVSQKPERAAHVVFQDLQ